jgi:hypothetical protein
MIVRRVESAFSPRQFGLIIELRSVRAPDYNGAPLYFAHASEQETDHVGSARYPE